MHSRHFFQLKGDRFKAVDVLFHLLLIFILPLLYIVLNSIFKIFVEQLFDNIKRLLLIWFRVGISIQG